LDEEIGIRSLLNIITCEPKWVFLGLYKYDIQIMDEYMPSLVLFPWKKTPRWLWQMQELSID